MLQKVQEEKSESARAGAEEGSLSDHTVTEPGKEATTQRGHKLQSCIRGWLKITSEKGFKIHQGRKKCLPEPSKWLRIDNYFLRGRANQSAEDHGQDIHHNPQDIKTPGEAQPSTHPPKDMRHGSVQPQIALERKWSGRLPQIQWPKSMGGWR